MKATTLDEAVLKPGKNIYDEWGKCNTNQQSYSKTLKVKQIRKNEKQNKSKTEIKGEESLQKRLGICQLRCSVKLDQEQIFGKSFFINITVLINLIS